MCDQSEKNSVINKEAESRLVTGLIEDQSRLKEMRLGVSDMAYAGCEVIAVYNALCLTGHKQSLSELIHMVEKSGILMRNGKWGTNPFSLERLCLNDGCSLHRLKKLPTEPGIYILSFWNSHRLSGGVHTVCLEVSEGKITTHNSFSETECHEEAIQKMLEKMLVNKQFLTSYSLEFVKPGC